MNEIPLDRLLEGLQTLGYVPLPAEDYPTFESFWEAVPEDAKQTALADLGLTLAPLDRLEVDLVGEGEDAVVVLNPVDGVSSPAGDQPDSADEVTPALEATSEIEAPEVMEEDGGSVEPPASEADDDADHDHAYDHPDDELQVDLQDDPYATGPYPDDHGAHEVDAPDDMDAALMEAGGAVAQLEGDFVGEEGEYIDPQQQALDEALANITGPSEDKHIEEVDLYSVSEPFGYVQVVFDPLEHRHQYNVLEPQLDDREQRILDFLENTIIDVLDVGLNELTEDTAHEMLENLVDEIHRDYSIEVEPETREKLLYYVIRDFLGFGPLDVLMRDPMIEDISCDGPDTPIFLYHRKFESVASNVQFTGDADLDSFVIKLAQRSGKHISIAEPLLDATLPEGSRLNATLSDEVTANGSTFTIRKFRPEPFTPPDLVRFGSMSPEMLAYLWMGVQHGASLIYAGGTASGKTTALNAILLFIPPQMKIVTIEDTREVNLPHPNWIPGTTRSGFGPRDQHGRQAGEIDMFTLLKAALRQRPEYIVVGEVRGAEATALFQAMATGHSAYGTMHADSVEAVIHRLESDPINIPRSLIEALDIVSIQMQTRIGGKRVRRTKEIVEVVGMDPNTKDLLTNEVFRWDPATDTFEASGISYVLERLQMENNMSRQELAIELDNRQAIVQWMIEHGVRDYQQVARLVQAYYNEPDETMERVRADLGVE